MANILAAPEQASAEHALGAADDIGFGDGPAPTAYAQDGMLHEQVEEPSMGRGKRRKTAANTLYKDFGMH